MYTLYQLVSRIPLPTSLTLGHLPPGGRFVGRETRPLQPEKWQVIRRRLMPPPISYFAFTTTPIPSGMAVTDTASLPKISFAKVSPWPMEWAGIICIARIISSGRSDT